MSRVVIVAGGPSSEAAVSQASARSVREALVATGHDAVVVDLDPHLPARLAETAAEVVFPVSHGPVGEDGCLQGLLEVLEIPYIGCSVLASSVAASKPAAKVHFRSAGLPVAREMLVHRGQSARECAAQARARLGAAVVVKPASGGSAIGVTRVPADDDEEELASAIGQALAVDHAALVEELVSGLEVTCGVLDVDERGPRALPPTLILSKAASWYDFTSRYATGGSEHQCPAPLDAQVVDRVQTIAVDAFLAVGARDLGRLDFIVGETGSVTLLELNTLPGMTATSLFPEAAAAAGIPFPTLCDQLVRRALARPRRVLPSVIPMPG